MNVPMPKDATEAALQSRVMERASEIALSLKSGGAYTAYQQEPGIWGIYKRDGNLPDVSYLVNLNNGTCTCPFFVKEGYCKHHIGLELRLDEDAAEEALEAQCEAHDKLMEACELETTGCDPFAEF